MSRIPPESIDAAPTTSRQLLEGVKKQLSVVPNMFPLISNSAAALEGYRGLSAALSKGRLRASTQRAYCTGCLLSSIHRCRGIRPLRSRSIPVT